MLWLGLALGAGVASSCSASNTVSCPTGVVDPMPMSALPTGKPCAQNSDVCVLNVEGQCPGLGPNPSIANGWTCACKEGAWDCVITAQGGGSCPNYLGGHCGAIPPAFGLSDACWRCVDLAFICFVAQCTDYERCYCACEPTDGACIAKCRPLSENQDCSTCFSALAERAAGMCEKECKGQALPDAGIPPFDAAHEGAGRDAADGG